MDYFAVFGDPIEHSLSPRLHNLAIKEFGFDAFYGRYHLKDGDKLKDIFEKLDLKGANITAPHKEFAFKCADVLDIRASAIGSANTLIKRKNKIFGFNTDAPGFLMAIKPFGEISSALIIGAGGTSLALAYALKSIGVDVSIVNRSDKSEQFDGFDFCTWADFKPLKFDLVINSTSAGLATLDYPMPIELLEPTLRAANFTFDVLYNQITPFANLSGIFNKPFQNGANMLLYQAAIAFNLFYDDTLEFDKIVDSMKIGFDLNQI